MSTIELGFGPSPRAKYVYADFEKNPSTGWYFYNHAEEKHEPVEAEALTGYVADVTVAEKEFKGKMNEKLRLTIKAGPRTFVIETGLYTALSRSLVASLSRVPDKNIDTPLSIALRTGDEGTIFADVFNALNGIRIPYDYPKQESDVLALLDVVREKFGREVPAA
jgi:hypothetical protein